MDLNCKWYYTLTDTTLRHYRVAQVRAIGPRTDLTPDAVRLLLVV
jgi:hypothetical protein